MRPVLYGRPLSLYSGRRVSASAWRLHFCYGLCRGRRTQDNYADATNERRRRHLISAAGRASHDWGPSLYWCCPAHTTTTIRVSVDRPTSADRTEHVKSHFSLPDADVVQDAAIVWQIRTQRPQRFFGRALVVIRSVGEGSNRSAVTLYVTFRVIRWGFSVHVALTFRGVHRRRANNLTFSFFVWGPKVLRNQ